MAQELDRARNTYVDIDPNGLVTGLLHFDAPVRSTAATSQLVAADYLGGFSDLLGIDPGQLAQIGLSPGTTMTRDGVEFRFLAEKRSEGLTTVAYQQTVRSLPIWEAGLAVQIQNEPTRVLSAQSSRHTEVEVDTPTAEEIERAGQIKESELAGRLGLSDQDDGGSRRPKISARKLVVYRYRPEDRLRDRGGDVIGLTDETTLVPPNSADLPSLPLPPVPDDVRVGRHYVCVKVDFELPSVDRGALNWVAIIEARTLAVLYLRPFVDDVSGLVFALDPETTNGGPGPSASSAALNPVRVSKPLLGLAAPDGNHTQHLTGDTVELVDDETPSIAAPTQPAGSNFDYDARTNDFAAVNAYVHCDAFFRLVEGMGFARSSYFGGTTFPTDVDHRGAVSTTDGVEINAHCVGTPGGTGIARTTFMLANTSDPTHPLGLACDYRVVLHELAGHGVLYNHVSSANFKFSHSAGDSVAAILNAPESQAIDAFETFPWVGNVIGRRHDRTPAAGFGYAGNIARHPFDLTLDRGGYQNEQILSSAHFRLYRSIGGDSTDLSTRRFAARMATYLILKGISTLTPAVSPADARGWVTALQTADQTDWTSENITGGAYSKVIRWAFEKQGLFQSAGQATPNNNEGDPPLVDVYIEDGRGGEYPYQPVFWENQNIWNRTTPDGGTAHQDPIIGATNYAYVKIKNRGTSTATGVVVKGYHANPAAGLSFPNDWLPMTTQSLSAPNVPARNAGELTVGPFAWVPFHLGHECIIMIVSAIGDGSSVDNIKAGDLIPDWRLIPNDNNIAQRNVAPVSGGGTSGLTIDFDGRQFELKNPFDTETTMTIEATLPSFLADRDWRLAFTQRGGSTFALKPGESRTVVMRLLPGSTFTASDVDTAPDKTIRVNCRAGGVLVGGLSYLLDPARKPEHRGDGPDGCDNPTESRRNAAEELLGCLSLPEEVSAVRVRKVTVDIEFDACP